MPTKTLLFALILALSACGPKPVRIAVPPVERFEQIAEPAVPEGEADCAGEPCVSDRQAAGFIAELVNALRAANDKIAWLRDWRTEVSD